MQVSEHNIVTHLTLHASKPLFYSEWEGFDCETYGNDLSTDSEATKDPYDAKFISPRKDYAYTAKERADVIAHCPLTCMKDNVSHVGATKAALKVSDFFAKTFAPTFRANIYKYFGAALQKCGGQRS